MHAARSACAARDAGRATARTARAAQAAGACRAPALTRRRFVALGGACAAAAVVVGVPLAWQGGEGEGASTATAPTFGLAVAQAAEPGKSIVLQTSDATLMPLAGTNSFRCLELALNLSCTGEDIDALTFSLIDVPTETVAGTRPFEPAERTASLVSFMKDLSGDCDVAARDDWMASMSEEDQADGQIFAVDLRENPNWNGARQTAYGTEYDALLAGVGNEKFWNQDPVMAAKKAMLDAECSADASEEEVNELTCAYTEAYAQVSATQEDAVAWARGCYVASCAMAARNLSKTTLQVEAAFADGSTLTKRYRISTVDDFEDVMGARYDALYELRSDEPDLWYRIAPFYSFTEEYHRPSEDARLNTPIFTITDITDAEETGGATSKKK